MYRCVFMYNVFILVWGFLEIDLVLRVGYLFVIVGYLGVGKWDNEGKSIERGCIIREVIIVGDWSLIFLGIWGVACSLYEKWVSRMFIGWEEFLGVLSFWYFWLWIKLVVIVRKSF